jgi:hypothetical protein
VNLTYNDINHEYKLDGMTIPSVTQVLKGAGLVNLDFVNEQLLEEKADLGKKVHLTTELYDNGTLDLDELHPTLKAYLDQWIKFRKDFNFIPTEIELQLFHKLYRYAGRIDRVGLAQGVLTELDIKSGMKFKHHAIQNAGYELLYNQGKKRGEQVKKRMTVYLSTDGYKVEPHNNENDKNVFLSALTISNYLLRSTK